MIGIGLAASGHFPYAVKYNGAMAVANFNFAILMRNEIFGRLLYLFVNTLFAKVTVSGVYPPSMSCSHTFPHSVDTTEIQARYYIRPSGRYTRCHSHVTFL